MESKICNCCKSLLTVDNFILLNAKNSKGENYKRYRGICKKCNSIKYKEYANTHSRVERDARYYAKNKERIKLTKKLYFEKDENKEKRKLKRKLNRNEKMLNPINRLIPNIRSRINMAVKHKSNSTMKLLGCDITFYRKWIEYTMTDDMNWDNYGIVWHIDHIIPISKFDLTKEENQYKAFNWQNTCALTVRDNLIKSNKIIENQIIYYENLKCSFLEKQ